ncbi:NADH-quinone oxidoreductase subunit A [Candidatus Bathyarchaeota archaeon]|nr:NADH-quinone oxidoreductase subunit A [Candidatus Bathyarchaeota archaeon]
MIYLGDHIAFWLFAAVFVAFLSIAIIFARWIGPLKPNPIKENIYECGQTPFGRALNFRITGAVRYFGYAVVFFALDAFSWMVLTSAMSISTRPESMAISSLYILIVLVGVGYFLSELRRVVR